MTETELVGLLVKRQRELKLSDARMAERLQVSRELWNKTKLGQKHIKAKVLRGIVRAFPEFTFECLEFLRRNGTKVAELGTAALAPQASQTHLQPQHGPSESTAV